MDLPVTIIGGYLGAGKTSLVNHLLRHNEGQRLAVLVNEFGDLPIDADLIEAEEDGLISISGGCVCCAFGSDLIGALEDVLAMDPRPDHLLIEASGVALPASIATTTGLMAGMRSDAMLVLADADQIRRNAANPYLADTIERQLGQADMVLLTKLDLVTEDERADVTAWLKERAPRTRLLPVTRGEVPITAVLGSIPLPARGHRPGGGAHGLFESLVMEPGHPLDAAALAEALAKEPGVTRAKGFVPTSEGMMLIHVVGNRCQTEPASEVRAPAVVCIGLKGEFDADRVREAFDRCALARQA
ncbi:CobW family GTP-binding protein [Pseudoroseicyclus tamaricis]|uniref:GTP-binding protein n=1 Tax=Pseudoroseicyclus tamaricis TaxID=2705421 RepID=A0A6B2JFZ8_9RHOB|nr:CobW family GTP-binding protein [Pseudoroseicyclus tamaricis]NDV00051.1 GTP-binding protein [Pseudoroseicyclus tamaricis]